MPAFKSAYLIHGDDHGRIAERRAKLKELAERESGAQGVELFADDNSTPANVAAALNAMTFAIGRRFLIVDGVERWKDKEVKDLVAALKQMPPDTTVSFFAREDGRMKAPAPLAKAVKAAGGDVSAEAGVKPWELPKWVVAEGRKLGLKVSPDAARTLVSSVGERQQRLLRELEKVALYLDLEGRPLDVDAELVTDLCSHSSQRKAWTIADALLSGNGQRATTAYLELRGQGERLPGLIYWISSRLRQAHGAAVALERGESPAQIKRGLRMPPKAADQLLADARRAGVEQLRGAVEQVADLELASRGGAAIGGAAGEDTHALLAIRALTS